MKNKEFIYEYWGRTELGRAMIKSNNVSESDLLFLIPNNVKRMHGLPLTRISGKKKRKQKEQRKRFILSFKLFDIIEEIVGEITDEYDKNETSYKQISDNTYLFEAKTSIIDFCKIMELF
jgi:hypothetical protein